MKKSFAIVLALVLLLAISGCRQAEHAVPTAEKPLRICFDMGTSWDEEGGRSRQEQYVQDLISTYFFFVSHTEGDVGLTEEQIEIEYIPSDEDKAADRSAVLQRLRTEIMGGGGPDVFVCVCDGMGDPYEVEGSRLFPYVEFAMEDNLFLPLDEYMTEFTYTDPQQLTAALLDGGKNEAGEQVVIPFRYTIPVLYFERGDLEPVDQSGKTWDDVLTSDDPLLKEQVRWAWPIYWGFSEYNRHDFHESALPCLLPAMVDTQRRTLAFTEDELFELVQKSLSATQELLKEDSEILNDAWYFMRTGLGLRTPLNRRDSGDDDGLTLLPMRNQTGGVTAMICSYGAVNANTAYPKEAASLLDYLSRAGVQTDQIYIGGATVFGGALTEMCGMPVNAEARTMVRTLNETGFLFSPWSLDEWEKATQQIDTVHFPSEMDTLLKEMTREIGVELRKSVEPENVWPACPEHYANGTISEEKMREIVHEAYKKMVERIGEA